MRTERRFFGAAVSMSQLAADADFAAAVRRECDVLVPEIGLKWAHLEPAPGALTFDEMDSFAAFAINAGKKVRGHTLLWHGSVPGWANDVLDAKRDWDLVARYFGSVIPRYGDIITEWDVVNEPIETGHRADGLRDNVFLRNFGPDYIERALRQARIFAPQASLMLNEYGLEYDCQPDRDRRYLFLKLMERLVKTGVPLDGIGLQSHLDLAKGPFKPLVYARFLQQIADFGLHITITELDVKERDYALPSKDRDLRVADAVRELLSVARAQPALRGVVSWGLSDRYSWLKVTADDFARFPGAWRAGDGPGVNRGLPLDGNLQPKAAYQAALYSAKKAG